MATRVTLGYLRIKPTTQSQQGKKWYPIYLSGTYLPSPYMYMGLSPSPKTSCVTWQANIDWDDECQVILEFSVVKCCFCYLNIFEFKYMKWFISFSWWYVTGSFMSFIKAILGRHTCLTKEKLTLWQSAMNSYYKLRQLFHYKVRHGLLQVATGITKCDNYYRLLQYIILLWILAEKVN